MADAKTPGSAADAPHSQTPPAPPPPLTEIRVRGPDGRGLNKKAILIAIGGVCAVVLVLASTSFSNKPAQGPAAPGMMMSAPSRPEMAKGALRTLPATYDQAAEFERARTPKPDIPVLGPPLPGDVAAFAPELRRYTSGESSTDTDFDDEVMAAAAPPDPAVIEAKQADRSTLFFTLREKPPTPASLPPQQIPPAVPGATRAPTPQQTSTPHRHDRALFPGAVIPASLITAISSEAPGPVIAQVTQTVYDSATGQTPLIPQGARLIGQYKSGTRYGQSRIVIDWSRIIMPDGKEIPLAEAAMDPSGATGIPGEVDNHWLDVFGAATLGTLINVGVATTEDPQITYGGIGAVTRDPVDQAVSEGVQRAASSVTNRVVDRSLAIPPTIRIEAGRRIAVMVTRRQEFPVTETE